MGRASCPRRLDLSRDPATRRPRPMRSPDGRFELLLGRVHLDARNRFPCRSNQFTPFFFFIGKSFVSLLPSSPFNQVRPSRMYACMIPDFMRTHYRSIFFPPPPSPIDE